MAGTLIDTGHVMLPSVIVSRRSTSGNIAVLGGQIQRHAPVQRLYQAALNFLPWRLVRRILIPPGGFQALPARFKLGIVNQ